MAVGDKCPRMNGELLEAVAFRAWITNNPDGPGFRSYAGLNASAEAWADLPDDGMEGVVLYFNRKRADGQPICSVLSGKSFYFRWDGPDGIVWDLDDSREDIEARYPGAVIKRGRSVTFAVLEAIEKEMFAAPCPACE